MASPGGTSSGSSLLQTSGSEEDLQALMDQKRQKRMISNRESARRSRMRKQKHLDDLTAQVNQLRKENSRILTSLTLTTQHHSAVEAENSVLRTQMVELGNRLQSLSEILHCLNGNTTITRGLFCDGPQVNNSFSNPWNLMYMNQQPIMASVGNMFLY
ncbi:ocs element-binding factor 1 [Musa troglodytarum]|uniref:Ocs element-binding factor 1 n=1 Tax=Musa troglodytarum TaxID=320322 RepID=A0A9E7K098_9LILI|nr:ocs element-binding factor 1 [Musa troglodytarum]